MARILWADDEIDLLKPHVMFLENKGHELTTVQSGNEAIDAVKEEDFEIIFLDENMPGLTGLETLDHIKAEKPSIPIVMITKSEEESIMDSAIGGRINDYLIKPVNPNQILLSIKKNLEGKRLVNEKTTSSYQQKFRELSMDLQDRLDYEGWIDIYKRLVYWEIQFDKSDQSMTEVLQMQKNEANQLFCKNVNKEYENWLNGTTNEELVFSHQLLKEKLFPKLSDEKYFLVVIDNLRYDQWLTIKPTIQELFEIDEEELYLSILPTTTQYSRNALFAGLTPKQIKQKYPNKWVSEEEEGGKNLNEEFLLNENIKRNHLNVKMSYNKITQLNAGKKLVNQFSNLLQNDFNTIVYNFVDTLSHVRSEMEVIKELAEDESAYRSITLSWFKHSPLYELLQKMSDNKCKVMITTDHGTVRVQSPSKVIGTRSTNSNMRYKVGKNLSYNKKEVFEGHNPEAIGLPKTGISSSYIFAKEDGYFVYPNNYNQYVNLYKDTFQHGGISLEEMIIPYVFLSPK